MSIESRRDVARADLEADLGDARPDDLNAVTVVFADGDVDDFSLVVRRAGAEWAYAERCVDVDDEFVSETVVSIRAETIRQIESDHVHLFDGGVVHYGECLLLDPAAVLEESWFDDPCEL